MDPAAWNGLPTQLHDINAKELFKNRLNTAYMTTFIVSWSSVTALVIIFFVFLNPGTQFPEKENYAVQRQNTKTSWNGLYSSSSFTKLSRSRIALKR